MQGFDLAATAVRILTEPPGAASSGQRALVSDLVRKQLTRTQLGAAALARFENEPEDSSTDVLYVVLADAVATDPAFGRLLETALHVPVAAPPRLRPSSKETAWVWLLGLPQVFVSYVIMSVAVRLADSGGWWVLYTVLFYGSVVMTAAGVWFGTRLMRRRARTGALTTATVLNALILVLYFRPFFI
ncbi:hypothetical protein ACFV6B_10105 [Streptomyces microflavus]|uniref:hypothetical protein n=1 Tax=Streptomyces microflavus TaxID=1919 RepID=UPI00365F82D6